MEQSTHFATPFSKTNFPITLVCDHVTSPANAGSIFRLADAFGVAQIIFCESEFDITSNRLQRTARSTTVLVPYSFQHSINDVIYSKKKEKALLIGLEITSNSKPIQDIEVTTKKPICIFIGNEKNGLQNDVIRQIDACYHIPMYGANSSMNVSHATGIALYEITSKLNNQNQHL